MENTSNNNETDPTAVNQTTVERTEITSIRSRSYRIEKLTYQKPIQKRGENRYPNT